MTAAEIAALKAAEASEPEPTIVERIAEAEIVADMAYINGELALAMLNEMEE